MYAWAVVHRKYGGSNQGGRGRDGHKGGCKALQFPSWNLEEADGWHCVGALLACPFYTTDKRRGGNLANYCVGMADMGFGLSREDVMRTAFLIVEKSGATTHSRMACQREHGLMALLHVTLSYRSILRKPCLVLKKQLMRYLDKTGISTEAWKGNHWNVRQVISAEEGKTHKVIVCLSCSNVFPPMMIYPHQCLTKWKKVLFLVPSRSLNDLFFFGKHSISAVCTHNRGWSFIAHFYRGNRRSLQEWCVPLVSPRSYNTHSAAIGCCSIQVIKGKLQQGV